MSVDPPRPDVDSDDDSPRRAEDAAKAADGTSSVPPVPSTETLRGAPSRLPKEIGRYHVKRVIASGGMGTVYEAIQEHPRRTVAVKVMRRGIASRSAMRRFEYESQILARLRHPGIAQVYEAGTHTPSEGEGRGEGQLEPVPFFAMEYIPNAKPITKYAQEKKLGTRERLDLFGKVCDAVHHGHQKGIIHRDLKPSNILVDSHGQPRIIDFGVARATDSDLAVTTLQTDVGQLIGTVQYMSPEQCEADPHDLDTRSDVYALGVVLYELLCRKLPYDVSKVAVYEATRMVREHQPTRLSTIDRALRGDVETIVFKALEKDRERRYQSAIELKQDIKRYLTGEAIIARPPSIVYQLRVFARRNKAFFSAVSAAFVVLVAGVIVSTALYVRAERERVRAVAAELEQSRERERAESERDRALEAEALARQETARFKAATGLLQDVVASLNPESAPARAQGVRAAIDAAAQRLDGGLLASAPESELPLRRMLAELSYTFGRYEESRQHLQRAVELGQAIPEARSQVLYLQYSLAFVLTQQGRAAEARTLLEEALSGQPRPSDRPQPLLLVSEYMLAILRRDLHEMRAVIEAYRRIPEVQHKLEHGDDEETTLHLARMAYMLMRTGDVVEAEPYWRRLLDLDRRFLGDQHLLVGNVWEFLALVAEAKGKLEKAEELLRRALPIKRYKLYYDAPPVGFTLTNLGRVLAKQGRLDEAELSLREALAILAKGSPEPWMQFEAQSILGSVLCKRGEYLEAEPLLLEGYQRMIEDVLTWRGREREALERIVRLYEAWSKPEKAAEYRAMLSGSEEVEELNKSKPNVPP